MAAQTPNPSRHEEFVALYVRHEPAVFSFVLSMVQDTAIVEHYLMGLQYALGDLEIDDTIDRERK